MPRSFAVVEKIPRTKVGKADTDALLNLKNDP
jgi:hypothetical protein